MSESNEPYHPSVGPPPLTPQGAAIAGFTLAVLSITSASSWVFPVDARVGMTAANGSTQKTIVWLALVNTLVAVLALGLARIGLRSDEGTARHLAGATVVVGGLSVLVAVASLVAAATM